MVDLTELKAQHMVWVGMAEVPGAVSKGQLEDSRTILALIEKLEKAKAALNQVVEYCDADAAFEPDGATHNGGKCVIHEHIVARACLKELGE